MVKQVVDYLEKFETIKSQTLFGVLNKADQEFLSDKAIIYKFTFQEFKQLVDVAIDYEMWGEQSLDFLWPSESDFIGKDRDVRKKVVDAVIDRWNSTKSESKDYSNFRVTPEDHQSKVEFKEINSESKILGVCPVSSDKTRCCQLLTLDAIVNCGYDCSYCSIQTFYHDNKVLVDLNLKEKLDQLNIDPQKIYHIGTGQSSDSLIWGNKNGCLELIIDFARNNPNVILELKTKSDNVAFLQSAKIPRNIIATWSLNTDTIIANEEHGTVSLEKRLSAARKVADKNILVGFHFHPMVYYKNWQKEYSEIFKIIQEMFKPSELAMISFGTLTFIKPVIKKIRQRNFKSKILQMPMTEVAGKYSYPEEIKVEMFSHAYNSFDRYWKDNLFFYFCMEQKYIWDKVFGYDFKDNDHFEQAMKDSYQAKINMKV